MNAAIDQNCEKYIKENDLENEVDNKISKIYEEKRIEKPKYQGEIPEGNDGLGLMLLGLLEIKFCLVMYTIKLNLIP